MIVNIRNKQFKLPNSLRIGVHDYEVLDDYGFRETYNVKGQADHDLKQIRLNSTQSGGHQRSDSDKLVTYLHELLHSIDRVYNDGVVTDGNQGEQSISCLAEGLAQVLIDNEIIHGIDCEQ